MLIKVLDFDLLQVYDGTNYWRATAVVPLSSFFGAWHNFALSWRSDLGTYGFLDGKMIGTWRTYLDIL